MVRIGCQKEKFRGLVGRYDTNERRLKIHFFLPFRRLHLKMEETEERQPSETGSCSACDEKHPNLLLNNGWNALHVNDSVITELGNLLHEKQCGGLIEGASSSFTKHSIFYNGHNVPVELS